MRAILCFLGMMALITALPGTAYPGGFEFPDNGTRAIGRGGAFIVKADDLTAIDFNPSGLAYLKGTRLLFDSNISFLNIDFTRAGSDLQPPYLPYQTVSNSKKPFYAPFFAVSSDFTLKFMTVAFGVYGPSAIGKREFPETGAQRYNLVSSDIMLVYYTLAMGFRIHEKFALGASFQWVDLMQMNFNMIVDGHPLSTSAYKPKEDRDVDTAIHSSFKDRFNFTAIVGMLYKPFQWLEFGLSARVIPINIKARGTIKATFPEIYDAFVKQGELALVNENATLYLNLPIKVRFGARYRYLKADKEVFDVELNVFYEAWSIVDRFLISPEGHLKYLDSMTKLQNIIMKRKFHDTWSFRIGGDWKVLPDWLTLRAGYFFETGASPRHSTNLDFLSFNRHGLGAGLTFNWKGLGLSISYLHIFQETRNIGENETSVHQLVPFTQCVPPYTNTTFCYADRLGQEPGNKIGAGKYVSSFDVLSVGLEIHFDAFFKK